MKEGKSSMAKQTESRIRKTATCAKQFGLLVFAASFWVMPAVCADIQSSSGQIGDATLARFHRLFDGHDFHAEDYGKITGGEKGLKRSQYLLEQLHSDREAFIQPTIGPETPID